MRSTFEPLLLFLLPSLSLLPVVCWTGWWCLIEVV